MKHKLYLIAILLVLLSATCYATSFQASMDSVKSKITIDEDATYRLTITNTDSADQKFQIKVLDYPRWEIYNEDQTKPITLTVKAGESASMIIYIDPNPNYLGESGSHFVNIEVLSLTYKDFIVLNPTVGLYPSDQKVNEYVATVSPEVKIKSEFMPKDTARLQIDLINRNKLDIKGALLKVESKFFASEESIDIGPSKTKTITLTKTFSMTEKPTQDDIAITLTYEGESLFDTVKRTIKVLPVSNIKEKSADIKAGFITRKTTITYINEGNENGNANIAVDAGIIQRYFSKTTPKATLENVDGKLQYVWDKELGPYEEYTVLIDENYLSLLLIFIVIVSIIVYYSMKKSPAVIKKEIKEIEQDHGISKVKVQLTLKNATKKKLVDVTVVEKLPALLGIEKTAILGSLKPTKIMRNKQNDTIIMWGLDELAGGEERVITYFVKTHLKIVGGITLNKAVLKFKDKGKQLSTMSNSVKINE